MKFEIKVMILSALIMSIALSLMSIEKSFAQSDDDSDNNNAIGQKGEGNKASQSESNIQDSNQNSMCVSGESVSLSCNNLSSELSGVGIPGEQGPTGPPAAPPSLAGNVYVVIGNVVSESEQPYEPSTASCKEGDTLVSGYGTGSVSGNSAIGTILNRAIPEENEFQYSVEPATNIGDQAAEYYASAICFDNP